MLFDEIHHVSLNVSDAPRALTFYRDILGMAVLPRPELSVDGVWLDAGAGRQVHLIEARVPPDAGQHVAFGVASIDQAIAALRAAGVDVGEAQPVGDTGMFQVFVSDPDGNRIEFTQSSA